MFTTVAVEAGNVNTTVSIAVLFTVKADIVDTTVSNTGFVNVTGLAGLVTAVVTVLVTGLAGIVTALVTIVVTGLAGTVTAVVTVLVIKIGKVTDDSLQDDGSAVHNMEVVMYEVTVGPVSEGTVTSVLAGSQVALTGCDTKHLGQHQLSKVQVLRLFTSKCYRRHGCIASHDPGVRYRSHQIRGKRWHTRTSVAGAGFCSSQCRDLRYPFGDTGRSGHCAWWQCSRCGLTDVAIADLASLVHVTTGT